MENQDTPVVTEQIGDYTVTTEIGYPFDQQVEYTPVQPESE